MSLLEQQLKQLQTKKEKIAYFRETLNAIELLGKPAEGNEPASDARAEVIEELTNFINSQIETIESGKEIQKEQAQAGSFLFSADEVEVLKALAARASGRVETTVPRAENKGAFANDDEQAPQPPKPNPKDAIKGDKIRFALAHRHLDQKRVTINSPQGKVRGTVVGIDAPHIIVKTETGHTVPVDLDHLTVE